MKERLVSVTRNQAKEETVIEGENARLEDCPADNRVRLFFSGKPDESIRADLKALRFSLVANHRRMAGIPELRHDRQSEAGCRANTISEVGYSTLTERRRVVPSGRYPRGKP